MTPRCFLTMGGIGPRRIGGEIFSNVKTGMVHPLVVELKHSWNSPLISLDGLLVTQTDPSRLTLAKQFKHNLCQIGAIRVTLRTSPRNPKRGG
jgi:hypothetical protein